MSEAVVPRVGVGVLVVDDGGRVLLSLRRFPPEAGCWSILGGRLEGYERLEDCALREVREEAGLEVVLERLLCITDHILPSEGQHWVSPAYLGRIVRGRAANREPDKTAAVEWFDLENLPADLTQTARNAIRAYVLSAKERASRGPHAE
jgi:ADP-ribose pyrophosphatase